MNERESENSNERKSSEYSCGCSRGLHQSDSIWILSNRPIEELMHSHQCRCKYKYTTNANVNSYSDTNTQNLFTNKQKWNLKFKTIKLSEENISRIANAVQCHPSLSGSQLSEMSSCSQKFTISVKIVKICQHLSTFVKKIQIWN